jgi:proline dehydrogenase
MAIDGIGKPPVSGMPAPAASIGNSEPPARSEFGIESVSKAAPGAEVSPVDSELLRRLESGQVSQEQYLDIKAEQAVSHLVGRLPAEKLELIRATLRDQLSNDPLFQRLVRQVMSPLGQR